MGVHINHHPGHQSRGLSLIEFMVSITLGLVVVLASMSTYLSVSRATRFAEAQDRMNDDAQAALTILTQQLRMAGNNPKRANQYPVRNPVYDSSTFMLRGCDGVFDNLSTATSIGALICSAGNTNLPDSLAITYEADRYNTVATSAGLPSDCLGQSLPVLSTNVTSTASGTPSTTAFSFSVAENRFYIGTSAVINAPSLYCLGNGASNPMPLVENVEDLQISYGTSPATTGTGTVAGYLSANALSTDAGLLALSSDAARWSRVVSVRLCVLIRSESPVVSDLASAQYTRCDGTVNTHPPDLRLRHAYSTTVVLRNRI